MNDTDNITSTPIETRIYEPIEETTFITHCAISSIGIVTNFTVIIVFLNDKKLRKKIPNIFIINQSSIDLLCSLALLLRSLSRKHLAYLTRNDGILGHLECGFWYQGVGVLVWGGFLASTYNLLCLTIERYLELVHPIWHKTHFKMKYLYMALAFAWIFGIGFNAAYMIPTAGVVDGFCRNRYVWPKTEEARKTFAISTICIQFFIPLTVLVFCYGRIAWMLTTRINTDLLQNKSKSNVEQVNETNTGNTSKDKFQLARKNTIKTLLIVGLCFIICWSQNQIEYLMYNLGYPIDFNSNYHNFTVLMVFINCTVNPFVYLIKYRDYQEALKKFFSCIYHENNSLGSSSVSGSTSLSAV